MLDIRNRCTKELLHAINGLHLVHRHTRVVLNQHVFLRSGFSVGCPCDPRDGLLLRYELFKVLRHLNAAVNACWKCGLVLSYNTGQACRRLILSEILAVVLLLSWDWWLLACLILLNEELRSLGVLLPLRLLRLLRSKHLGFIGCQTSEVYLCKCQSKLSFR